MKTVQDIMIEKDAEHNIAMFRQLQAMDHEHKVYHAEEVIENFLADARDAGLNTHISVGGLDSITLTDLVGQYSLFGGLNSVDT